MLVPAQIILQGRDREVPCQRLGADEACSGLCHGVPMVRISAIFIAVCMVLIAGSLGAMLYLRFGFTGVEAAVAALGVLTALAVYNAISARKRDRAEVTDHVVNLARGTGDLARQLAEFGRRLSAMETKVETVLDKALSTAQPLAVEIEELSRLVKHLADSVAEHEVALGQARDNLDVPPRSSPWRRRRAPRCGRCRQGR